LVDNQTLVYHVDVFNKHANILIVGIDAVYTSKLQPLQTIAV